MKDQIDDMRAPPGMVGATGEFPKGKVHADDMGELRLAIAAFPERGIVAMDFGKSICWLGLEKENALELAEALRRSALELP